MMVPAQLIVGLLVALTGVALTGTAGETSDPVKKELKALQGVWCPKSGTLSGGKEIELAILPKFEIKADGQVTLTAKDAKYVGEVILDLKQSCKRMTFRPSGKPLIGNWCFAYSYELKGDMLTLVEAKVDLTFPNSLSDKGFTRYVYTRGK
jgi:uncharacterized protein (TIGR03067 family)